MIYLCIKARMNRDTVWREKEKERRDIIWTEAQTISIPKHTIFMFIGRSFQYVSVCEIHCECLRINTWI